LARRGDLSPWGPGLAMFRFDARAADFEAFAIDSSTPPSLGCPRS
jgi:hypothetical protein